jgi:ferri-bacillibactin esterase
MRRETKVIQGSRARNLVCGGGLGVALLFQPACTHGAKADAEVSSVEIPHSETFALPSSRTGRTYQISVALPSTEPPAVGFPVIYMTDADLHFGTMVDVARSYARGHRSAPDKSAVVVGIGYMPGAEVRTERSLDLTLALGDSDVPEGFGGATEFLHFISEDLKPEIYTRYSVDETHEALFGHSFGGLFALNTLFNQPDAFDSYLVASPSIWWGARFAHEVRDRVGPRIEETGARAKVFLSVGELEQMDNPPPPPANRPLLPGVADRTQVDDAVEMAEYLSTISGLDVRFHLFDGESHGSVVPAAISRGVEYLFDSNAPLPEPAPKPSDKRGGIDVDVPTAAEYIEMTPEERYSIRMEVRGWPETQRRAFLRQLRYNLESGMWYDEQHALHVERNAMDAKFGTRPVE